MSDTIEAIKKDMAKLEESMKEMRRVKAEKTAYEIQVPAKRSWTYRTSPAIKAADAVSL